MSAGTSRPAVDLRPTGRRRTARAAGGAVLGAVSAGGALGALARYGLGEAFGHAPGGWPWTTLGINVTGCLLVGVLMVLITERWPGRRLARPFLGVGVLGGFTTFSTYVVDTQQLLASGAARTALLYLLGTLLAAMVAVYVGSAVTRAALSLAGRGRRG
jgi:CrcB protein